MEQDYRGSKARCGPLKGFKSFVTAAVRLAGFELSHRISKRQFNFRRRVRCFGLNRQIDWPIALGYRDLLMSVEFAPEPARFAVPGR